MIITIGNIVSCTRTNVYRARIAEECMWYMCVNKKRKKNEHSIGYQGLIRVNTQND